MMMKKNGPPRLSDLARAQEFTRTITLLCLLDLDFAFALAFYISNTTELTALSTADLYPMSMIPAPDIETWIIPITSR